MLTSVRHLYLRPGPADGGALCGPAPDLSQPEQINTALSTTEKQDRSRTSILYHVFNGNCQPIVNQLLINVSTNFQSLSTT